MFGEQAEELGVEMVVGRWDVERDDRDGSSFGVDCGSRCILVYD